MNISVEAFVKKKKNQLKSSVGNQKKLVPYKKASMGKLLAHLLYKCNTLRKSYLENISIQIILTVSDISGITSCLPGP